MQRKDFIAFMKELDIIKHAKTYMDQLSKGIDPISKKEYSNNSDLKNERLMKCFSFVSEILERVIREEEAKEKNTANNNANNNANIVENNYDIPKNSLVDDSIEGEKVVDILLKKGLISKGFKQEK